MTPGTLWPSFRIKFWESYMTILKRSLLKYYKVYNILQGIYWTVAAPEKLMCGCVGGHREGKICGGESKNLPKIADFWHFHLLIGRQVGESLWLGWCSSHAPLVPPLYLSPKYDFLAKKSDFNRFLVKLLSKMLTFIYLTLSCFYKFSNFNKNNFHKSYNFARVAPSFKS